MLSAMPDSATGEEPTAGSVAGERGYSMRLFKWPKRLFQALRPRYRPNAGLATRVYDALWPVVVLAVPILWLVVTCIYQWTESAIQYADAIRDAAGHCSGHISANFRVPCDKAARIVEQGHTLTFFWDVIGAIGAKFAWLAEAIWFPYNHPVSALFYVVGFLVVVTVVVLAAGMAEKLVSRSGLVSLSDPLAQTLVIELAQTRGLYDDRHHRQTASGLLDAPPPPQDSMFRLRSRTPELLVSPLNKRE